MSQQSNMMGSCLCDAVKISTTSSNKKVGACHCGMCRKWSGSSLLVVNCEDRVEFTGAENITRFPSSEWAERGFCSKCGTHLFYWLKQNNHYYILAGIFERQDNFVFDHQIFIDCKPEYFAFANETNNMTEAEVMEMFGSLSGTP